MSMRTLFAAAARVLLGVPRGTRIKDHEGKMKDTQVQPLAEDLVAMFRGEGPIPLYKPLQFVNYTDGNAIEIINRGPTDQTGGIKITNEADQGSQVGIGLGNINIVANEYVPRLIANIEPNIASAVVAQGSTVRYEDLEPMGLDRPPESNARQDEQVVPGFEYREGQQYTPGTVDQRQGAISLAPALTINQFFQSWTKVNNTTWSFTWNNTKYYVTTSSALANGIDGEFEIPYGEPEFDPDTCTLTIPTATFRFEAGLLVEGPS